MLRARLDGMFRMGRRKGSSTGRDRLVAVVALLLVVLLLATMSPRSSRAGNPTAAPTPAKLATPGHVEPHEGPHALDDKQREVAPVHRAVELPTLSPNEAIDAHCAVTMLRDAHFSLLATIHLRSSDGTPCVPGIEPLSPHLPLRDVDVRCPLNRRRWFSIQEHYSHFDWEDIVSRKQAAVKLYAACRPQPPANPLLVYIDIGSKDYTASVKFFRDAYPNARNFLVHAYDVNARFADDATYADPSNHIFFHHFFVWNETGFVTFLRDRPVPAPGETADPLQEALDERPQRLVFHREQHGLAKEDIPAGIPEANLLTVPSISFVELLTASANVQDKDFVVLKLDVNGNERMLLEFLLVNNVLHLIDELFLVCHNVEMDPVWPDEQATPETCQALIMTLREAGVYVHEWYA